MLASTWAEDAVQAYLPMNASLGGGLALLCKAVGGPLDEASARFHVVGIAMALGVLHSLNIFHRNINLENIQLSLKGYPILTDLSCSKCFPLDGKPGTTLRAGTLLGMPEYASPEMVKGQGYGLASDWWALGVLLHRLLGGVLPFVAPGVQEVYNRISFAPAPDLTSCSLDAREVVQKLLSREPNRRLQKFEELQKRYWFEVIDWEAYEAGSLQSPTPMSLEMQAPPESKGYVEFNVAAG